MNQDSAFRAVGLSPGASIEEVKEAIKDLLKVWDPERFSDDPRLQHKAHEKLREIHVAYETILKNPPGSTVEHGHPSPARGDRRSGSSVRPNMNGSSNHASVIRGIPMVLIPGGTFRMGDESGMLEKDCLPVHSVKMSEFEMGVYEVTNSQYCAYLNEAMASGDIVASNYRMKGAKGLFKGKVFSAFVKPKSCGIAFDGGKFVVRPGWENWPVVWVTWYGAKAFALHYGLDLPTEAEWEYACRGGLQLEHGTDDGTIHSAKANYISDSGPKNVGSFPKNPFGLYDMSGNVWEWCHDWYSSDYYRVSPPDNPSGPDAGTHRVVRGGGWYQSNDYSRSAFRDGYLPDNWYEYVGFRVVCRVFPRNY